MIWISRWIRNCINWTFWNYLRMIVRMTYSCQNTRMPHQCSENINEHTINIFISLFYHRPKEESLQVLPKLIGHLPILMPLTSVQFKNLDIPLFNLIIKFLRLKFHIITLNPIIWNYTHLLNNTYGSYSG